MEMSEVQITEEDVDEIKTEIKNENDKKTNHTSSLTAPNYVNSEMFSNGGVKEDDKKKSVDTETLYSIPDTSKSTGGKASCHKDVVFKEKYFLPGR